MLTFSGSMPKSDYDDIIWVIGEPRKRAAVVDIRILQEFVVLSRHLKLASAAQELYISAPTLSQHISSLEQELGLTLFDRKGGLKLTHDGEEALTITQKLLHKYDELCDLPLKKHESLRWRIPNYAVGLKEFLLAKPYFMENHPHFTVDIETSELQMSDPFTIVKENQSDVSVLYLVRDSGKNIEDYLQPGFSSIHISTRKPIFLSTSEHPFSSREVLSLNDFEGVTIATTLCPVSFIHMESLRYFFVERGISIHILGIPVNRHEDMFMADLSNCVISWFEETSIAPVYESLGLRRCQTDFNLVADAYLLYRPDHLSNLHLSYLEVLRQMENSEPLPEESGEAR